MSQKSKGIDAERDLVHKFNEAGWVCVRVAGSGSMKYPSPDILAGNNLRRVVIECKMTKDKSKYLTRKEVDDLVYFAKVFGAEPWIGVRLAGEPWLFISIDDMELTEKSYSITLEKAKLKGLSFDEFIKE
ncbi:MAG: Holliday junction resolvase Hjc [Candidatus Woesearchaeota archaeon]